MTTSSLSRRLLNCAVVSATIMSMVGMQTETAFAASGYGVANNDGKTRTPIKHVIIIIGENRTFDHVFATFRPRTVGEKVSNLLSKGIVKVDGTPGPNYGMATQMQGVNYDSYELAPPKTAYTVLPPAVVGGSATPTGCEFSVSPTPRLATAPPMRLPSPRLRMASTRAISNICSPAASTA
jgi:phospholipase C